MIQIPDNRTTYLIYVFLMISLAWLAFDNLATLEFENDDHAYIDLMSEASQNPSMLFDVQRQVALRPPVDMLAFFTYLIWKDNPAPYHILLVTMQLVASLLLAYTFYILGARLETSLLGGLLFLINVSHFRVVQWITCRSYILTLIFGLFVLIHFYAYLNKSQSKNLVYAILFLILSIFTHPATFTFALFCTYLAWRKQGSFHQAIFVSWKLLIIAPICVMAASAISMQSDQVRGIDLHFDFLQMFQYLFWYSGRLLTNAHWILANFQEVPERWELYTGFFFCVGILLLLFFRKNDHEALWGVWTLLTILPFVYVPHVISTGPSRHIYFASAGSSFILSSTVVRTTSYIGQFNHLWGKIIFAIVTLGLVCSSFFALKRTEAIAFYATGRSYISIGNWEKGAIQLQKAYEHEASIVPFDGYLRLATSSFAQGIPQTTIFEKGLELHSKHPQLLMLLGLSYYLNENIILQQRGRKLVAEAFVEAEDKDALHFDTGLVLQNLAAYYHKNENFEKAASLYQEAISHRPDYVLARFNLARAFFRLKRYDEGINELKQIILLDPQHKSAIQFLGNQFIELRRYAEAEPVYRRYLQLDNRDPNIHYNLGLTLHRQERYSEAVQAFQTASELAPNDIEIHLQWAEALRLSGEPSRAFAIYKAILENHPAHHQTLQKASAFLLEQQRPAEALELFNRALAFNSASAETWYLLAHVYQETDDLKNLRIALKNAIRHAPQERLYLESYLNLGGVLQQQGHLDLAREVYGELIAYAPNMPAVHHNLGILNFAQQHYGEAIENFARATRLAPDDPEAHLGLAQAYEKNGQNDQAHAAYQRVLALQPENSIAQTGLRNLK